MSFEPTLVIKKSDLAKHNLIDLAYTLESTDPELFKVVDYLRNIYEKNDTVVIDNLELIICRPELTSFNKDVRDYLDELEVQFGIDN